MDEATAFLPSWQKILRLEDWDFEVKPEYPHRMDDCAGTINMDFNHKKAWIKLAEPEMLDGENRDLHHILVHELLHVILRPIEHYEGRAQDEALEQACNKIGAALVGLAREVYGKD